jgi:rhodanese-related sulfurtransferase
MRSHLTLSMLLFLLAAGVAPGTAQAGCYEGLGADELAAMMASASDTPVILDVRTEGEFRSRDGHIAGAILVPVDMLADVLPRLESLRDREVVVVCRSGNRSSYASSMLCREGFGQVSNLAGGMNAWVRAGLPTER